MPVAAWLEIPDFAVRFAAACLSGTFKYLFLIILLIKANSDMLIAAILFYEGFLISSNFSQNPSTVSPPEQILSASVTIHASLQRGGIGLSGNICRRIVSFSISLNAKSSTNKDALQEDVIQGVQEAIQEDAGDGIVITIEVDR